MVTEQKEVFKAKGGIKKNKNYLNALFSQTLRSRCKVWRIFHRVQ